MGRKKLHWKIEVGAYFITESTLNLFVLEICIRFTFFLMSKPTDIEMARFIYFVHLRQGQEESKLKIGKQHYWNRKVS